jgi:hypothetical protein
MAVRPHKNMVAPLLAARSADDRGCHEWQFSTDGGKTWSSAPRTVQGKTILMGFAPGQTIWLRHRLVTLDREGAFCDPIALVIK